MIFVTVGHKEFDRLVKAIDKIAEKIDDDFVIQIGDRPKYIPKNAKFFYFLTRKEIGCYFQKANLIISHCSIGPLLQAKHYAKPIILVPRLKLYNEAVNNHQVEFSKMLLEQKDIFGVEVIFDIEKLEEKIAEVLKNKNNFSFKPSAARRNLLETLSNFVNF